MLFRSQTYGAGNTFTAGYSWDALVTGDTVTATLETLDATTSSSGNWNAGNWTISVASTGGADAANYRITPGQTTTAAITRKNDDGTSNFLLGTSRIPGIGGFKAIDSSDIQYPLPKTFLLGSAAAVKEGDPTALTSAEIGARPVMGYYTSENQPSGLPSFRYVYPKVNLGKAYYVEIGRAHV